MSGSSGTLGTAVAADEGRRGVMDNYDTLGDSALRYLPASHMAHGSGTFAGVTMCTAEGEPLGELAGMVVEPASRRARFLVVERGGMLRSRRYQLDATTPAVLD